MLITELLAVLGVLSIVGMSFASVACASIWLLHGMYRGYLDHLGKELDLRRFEAETRLKQSINQATIPVWVDREDPIEVASWNRAVAETWRITTMKELA